MMKTRLMATNSANEGFTLIELMIAIAVLGVLLAIAVPSYTKYLRESRRAEAQADMMQIRLGLERWRANNSTYSSNLADAGFIDNNDYYDYQIIDTGANTYTIVATAVAGTSQAGDVAGNGTPCTTLTLDQSGAKGPAGCWKK